MTPITLNKRGTKFATKAGRPAKYPFESMKVGDSFTIEATNYSAMTSAKKWAERNQPSWTFKSFMSKGKLTIKRTK